MKVILPGIIALPVQVLDSSSIELKYVRGRLCLNILYEIKSNVEDKSSTLN
jgi:uncharacterized protein YacL